MFTITHTLFLIAVAVSCFQFSVCLLFSATCFPTNITPNKDPNYVCCHIKLVMIVQMWTQPPVAAALVVMATQTLSSVICVWTTSAVADLSSLSDHTQLVVEEATMQLRSCIHWERRRRRYSDCPLTTDAASLATKHVTHQVNSRADYAGLRYDIALTRLSIAIYLDCT